MIKIRVHAVETRFRDHAKALVNAVYIQNPGSLNRQFHLFILR